MHLHRIHGEGEANEQAALWGLQIDFLRIVSSHEHFIPLNLPQVCDALRRVEITIGLLSTVLVGGLVHPRRRLRCVQWTRPPPASPPFLVIAGWYKKDILEDLNLDAACRGDRRQYWIKALDDMYVNLTTLSDTFSVSQLMGRAKLRVPSTTLLGRALPYQPPGKYRTTTTCLTLPYQLLDGSRSREWGRPYQIYWIAQVRLFEFLSHYLTKDISYYKRKIC